MLRARLAELDDERKQVEFALSILERVDDGAGSRRRARRSSSGGPSTVELAVALIDGSGRRTWRVADVIEALESQGWGAQIADKTSAVRTSLTRAVERKLIARHGQGEYVSLAFKDEPAIPEVPLQVVAGDDPWSVTSPTTTFNEEPPF